MGNVIYLKESYKQIDNGEIEELLCKARHVLTCGDKKYREGLRDHIEFSWPGIDTIDRRLTAIEKMLGIEQKDG